MKTREDAEKLALGLQSAGQENNVITQYLLTPMAEPLGETVGNALEVKEAVETLQGKGPRDFVELTLDLCERVANSPREKLAGWLKDGTAWEKFTAMVSAQGGDATALERITKIHHAPVIKPFPAPRDGTIERLDAGTIGAASVRLGAGRQRASDTIDCAVGFSGIRKCGEQIAKGEPLFFIHARTGEAFEQACHQVAAAVSIR